MSQNQPVDIEVLKIENYNYSSDNKKMVTITIKDTTGKESTYIRKLASNKGRYFAIVAGCRIWFTRDTNSTSGYILLGVEREYDVKGSKRKSTAGQVKRYVPKLREEKDLNDLMRQESIKRAEQDLAEYREHKEEHREKRERKLRTKHIKYNQIMTCIEVGIPVYLAGPAGSGKNYTVEKIAEELGWNFYFSNSIQQEYKLTGFIDAGGKYHETEFYKACMDEEECIFFLDEIDASIPDVLVLLNAAIANGYFEFPNRRVDFDNVHFVAAGNTLGNGADERYTGRMVLDSATLDRFAIIPFDYDRDIELGLANRNVELVNFIHDVRDFVDKRGLRHTVSYRCIKMVTSLEEAEMSLEDILDIVVFKGVDKDTRRIISDGIPDTNKYSRALKAMVLVNY